MHKVDARAHTGSTELRPPARRGASVEYQKCQNGPRCCGARLERMSGGVLLSHTLASAVPSALEGLASGFGMGPGVSPPLSPPKHCETIQPAEPPGGVSMPVGVSESYSGCEPPQHKCV